MIYLCTHMPNATKYTLHCEYQIMDNNISGLHAGYRHLRSIYNLWNNASELPDVIGIFQHRRYLSVLDLPDGIDAVVPNEYNYLGRSIEKQFNIFHPDAYNMFLYAEDLIGDEFKRYAQDENVISFWHNVFIMNKSNFLNYSAFLFDVLGDIDEAFPWDGVNPYLAWIGERLGSYWIVKNLNNIFVANTIKC